LGELYIPSGHGIVSWIFALSGSSHQFGFTHGLDVDVTADGDPQTVADDAADAFLSGYGMANAYNAWTFVKTHALTRSGPNFFSADSVHNTVGTGGSGAVNTANLAMIVKKSTIFAGRKFRGRMYWPCLSLLDADVDNAGNINPAVVATIQGNVDDFRSDWEGKGSVAHINVLHTATDDDPTPDGTTVTNWTVEALCGTQRRRQR
jgi:hypothetical protein